MWFLYREGIGYELLISSKVFFFLKQYKNDEKLDINFKNLCLKFYLNVTQTITETNQRTYIP